MRPPERTCLGAASLLLCAALSVAATGPPAGSAAAFEAPLDLALKRHVHDGLVDYRALKTDVDFAAAVSALARVDAATLATTSERLAFWINAYNALVIRQVLDNFPIGSVTEVGLAGRWSFFKNAQFTVSGKPHTLDGIEHGIIRPVFAEARVHFALVCGAVGCPALRAGVWSAGPLESQLDEATRSFINDPSKVRPEPERGVLRLSPIFDWYADDFRKSAGSVVAFLNRYRTGPAIPAGLKIEYMEYSWSLNEWKGSSPGH